MSFFFLILTAKKLIGGPAVNNYRDIPALILIFCKKICLSFGLKWSEVDLSVVDFWLLGLFLLNCPIYPYRYSFSTSILRRQITPFFNFSKRGKQEVSWEARAEKHN